MTKIIKKISVPLISLLFLTNMSSAGNSETKYQQKVSISLTH